MKRATPFILIALLLSSCNGWIIQPIPYTPPTPFLPFTQTPSVFTATPVVIGVTNASATPVVATSNFTPTTTPFPLTHTAISVTETPTITATPQPGAPAILLKVLGCNTSIDITHSMGEVTNAFVTLTNNGGIQLTNIKITLFALDEDRVHPDKTVELSSLPVGYQVTVKLTVDSAYQQETPIQVEVATDQGTFPREGSASCTNIGLFAPNPAGLNTPAPVTP